MTLPLLLLTGAAGGLGACARLSVDAWVTQRLHARPQGGQDPPVPPLGTITVNLTACLLLGLLTSWASAASGRQAVATVLGTGLLGGYSTFSTACLEAARLLLAGRWSAHLAHALALTAGTLLAATAGLWLGSLAG